jgi:ABC-type uncharacterized transport system involved in gliding motility auxiliary subunit
MTTSVQRVMTSLVGLVVLLALFFGINALAGATVRGVRIDLTEGNLYSISDGSKAIAANIDEPIRLYFYFSKSLATGQPSLLNYGRRVRELLEEYERASGGQIILEVIDPEPFSDAEDEATSNGMAGIPMGGDSFYFGLLGRNSIDGQEMIPFFDPAQEQFLEYQVSRLIHSLANPDRPTIGVLAGLPIDGAPPSPMNPQPTQPWQIMREIRSQFDVQMVDPAATSIPEDVDVLLIVHPKSLSGGALYAIDQFVLAGGNAVIYVDPNCEADMAPGGPQDMMAQFQWDRSSNLKMLFDAWGVTLDEGGIACDIDSAQQVRGPNSPQPVSYIAWIEVSGDAIADEDPVTGRLVNLVMRTAGILTHNEGSGTTWSPLVQTSPESMRGDASKFKLFPDPKALLNEFESRGEPLTIAGRLSGTVSSAFPEGAPGETDGGNHLTASEGDINVIIVADVDTLTNGPWVQQRRLGNLNLGLVKLADNGDLLINALDNMTGSSELIGIRAHGRYQRPFTKVQEIRRAAEREYAEEEQQLQEELRAVEQQLNELQRARTDDPSSQGGAMVLTAEQKKLLEDFNKQRSDIRVKLRNVQHDLRKDVEKLGTRAQALNDTGGRHRAHRRGGHRGLHRSCDEAEVSPRDRVPLRRPDRSGERRGRRHRRRLRRVVPPPA